MVFSCGWVLLLGVDLFVGLLRAVLGDLGGFVFGDLFALRIVWFCLCGCILYTLLFGC